MVNLSTQIYAPFLKFEGTGHIEHKGYSRERANFAAGQFPDGTIEVVTLSKTPLIMRAGYVNQLGPSWSRVRGTTVENFQLIAEGNSTTSFSFSTSQDSSTTFIKPNSMRIINKSKANPKTIRFGITSFQFQDILGYGTKNHSIEIQHDKLSIKIYPSLRYAHFDKLNRIRKQADVTAIAEIEFIDGYAIKDYINTTNQLCRLLSIAQGTYINWVYFNTVSKDEIFINAFHRTAIVRPPSHFFIVSCQDIETFLKDAFLNYQSLIVDGLLDIAIVSSYIDAFNEHINIRTRSISLVVTLERLVHLYRDYAIRMTFNEDNSTIRKTLKSICSRFLLDDKDISVVLDHRNSLVHEAIFNNIPNTYSVDNASIAAYGILKGFVSRLILAMLGYRGHYINWSNRFPSLIPIF